MDRRLASTVVAPLAISLVVSAVLFAVLVVRSIHPRRVVFDYNLSRAKSTTREISLVVDKSSEVALLVPVRIGTFLSAMVLDTGYAGPPLISMPVLCSENGKSSDALHLHRAVQKSGSPSEQKQYKTLRRFMSDNACVSFTAGCRVDLMGISSSESVTSEMILAPPIELQSTTGEWVLAKAHAGLPIADVLSTTSFPTLHIMTLDWLRQVGPCCIMPSRNVLLIGMTPAETIQMRPSFTTVTHEMSGGAFVATIKVGGVDMRMTIDTGATSFLSLGASAASRIRSCTSVSKKVEQFGVNGEVVCSEVVNADLQFAGHVLSVPCFMNDTDLPDVDGYVGAALLCAFDLLILPNELMARKIADVDRAMLDSVSAPGSCGLSLRCASAKQETA